MSLTASVLLALAGATALPTPARAEHCQRLTDTIQVVGLPHLNSNAGGIEVRSYLGQQILTRSDLGLGRSTAGDRFGAAVTWQFEGDGCGAVLVGSPGVGDNAGAVFILHFDDRGLGPSELVRMDRPSPGDEFGYSVVVASEFSYAAGAPGRDVGGVKDAGAVVTFGDNSGQFVMTQATAGVAGVPERWDRFGEVIAGAGGGSLWVGVPREDIGNAVDAGMIQHVSFGTSGSPVLRQTAGGVFGPPEAGDRFGSDFAVGGYSIAVGVPGEDVGNVRDAGAVNVYSFIRGYQPLQPVFQGRLGYQGGSHVPGRLESGDRFGAAVESLYGCCVTDGEKIAVGAPGEDVRSVADAGTVTLLDTGLSQAGEGLFSCPGQVLRQGLGLPGRPEAGDRLGSALQSRQETRLEPLQLLVAAPGEDVGREVNAGIIGVAKPWGSTAQQFLRGPRRGLQYGVLQRF